MIIRTTSIASRCFRNNVRLNSYNYTSFGRSRYFRSVSFPLCEKYQIKVPDLGDSIKSADMIEWLKQPGDAIQEDEVVCVLETDKVTVDIRSPVTGSLTTQNVQPDETVKETQVLGEIEIGQSGSDTTVTSTSMTEEENDVTDNNQSSEIPVPAAKTVQESAVYTYDHLIPHKTLIKFRYGVRDDLASPDVVESVSDANMKDILPDSSLLYGRLPPLTDEEEMALLLGGADLELETTGISTTMELRSA